MKKVKKAIIPAAGYGTRSLPITKVVPKEMFPIKNKPAIQYIVEEAVAAGIEEILFVVSRNKNMIIDYFDRSLELEKFLESKNKTEVLDKTELPDVHIQFVRQSYANGLGAAILLGKYFAQGEPVAILLPDEIILGRPRPAIGQLIDCFYKNKGSVIGIKEVPSEHLHLYGVIEGQPLGNELFKITDLVEKPKESALAPSNYAAVGRYVLEPEIFHFLEHIPSGAGKEIQLTDALKELTKEKACFGFCIKGERYDIGKEEDYLSLITHFMNEKKGE